MASDFLNTATNRHQLHLQRLASFEANSFDDTLKRADKIIRDVLSRAGEFISTKAILDEIMRELTLKLGAEYAAWGEGLLDDMMKIGGQEADFTAKTLEKAVIGATVASVTTAAVWTAANIIPVQVSDKGESVLMQALVKAFTPNQVQRVTGVVRNGFYAGTPTQAIITQIRGTKVNQFKDGVLITTQRNAASIAKTLTNHMSNIARTTTFKKNKNILKGWEFSATLDNRTSSICRHNDGEIFPIGSGPVPPLHISCVTGDTNVLASGRIDTVYSRRYKGTAVNITTKSGRTLCITPNHPVLTSTGWKAVKLLNVGDKLVCTDGVMHGDNKDGMKSPIANLFCALDIATNSACITNRPASAEDFHSDVSNSEVSIIDVNSLSRSGVKMLNHFKHYRLDARSGVNSPFSSFGSLLSFCNSHIPTCSGFVSSFGKGFDLLRSGIIHSGLLLLRSISWLNPSLNKGTGYNPDAMPSSFVDASKSDAGIKKLFARIKLRFGKPNVINVFDIKAGVAKDSKDWLVTNAEVLPDLLNADLIDSSHFDDIVDLRFSEIDTHVYNLETGSNWYTANGIVTHNCRSAQVPVLKKKFDIFKGEGTRASKGASGGKQVKNQTYYEWLQTQPKFFQQEVLGKTQTELFRKGGLSTDQFRKLVNDKMGEPLNLEEIKRKNPSAWAEAGLDD